jgi:hypothetical protein
MNAVKLEIELHQTQQRLRHIVVSSLKRQRPQEPALMYLRTG